MQRRSHVVLVVGGILAACGGGSATPTPATPAGTTETTTKDSPSSAAPAVDENAPAPPPTFVDCGDFSTCAVGGDGLARCWGRNKDGELGLGEGVMERTKRGVVPGIGKVKRLALASQMTCAILENRNVTCWGSGFIANDGKNVDIAKPTPVQGVEDVEDIEASGAIVCARGSKGVTCWGGDPKSIGTAPAGAFTQITTGFTHACALDDKGTVTCWGGADWSGKGPFAKPGVTGATRVVTGDRHACVIAKDKTVQCWGMNDAGQLGTKPEMTAHSKPVAVPGVKDAVKLFAGEAGNCALLGDGSVKCWGSNSEGELGLGTRSSDERPQTPSGLSNVEHICFASSHACALTKDHKLLCWGANAFGQLGDGTKERRLSPTAVAW